MALLPRNAVLLFNDPKVVFVPVAELILERKLYLLIPVRRAPSPLAERFEEIIRKLAQGL